MYDVAIIGCGVIGAAAAYALSRYNNKEYFGAGIVLY